MTQVAERAMVLVQLMKEWRVEMKTVNKLTKSSKSLSKLLEISKNIDTLMETKTLEIVLSGDHGDIFVVVTVPKIIEKQEILQIAIREATEKTYIWSMKEI